MYNGESVYPLLLGCLNIAYLLVSTLELDNI